MTVFTTTPQEPKPVHPASHDDRFFNKLEDDVSKIVLREKRREQFSNSGSMEVTTSVEYEPVRVPIFGD